MDLQVSPSLKAFLRQKHPPILLTYLVFMHNIPHHDATTSAFQLAAFVWTTTWLALSSKQR